MHRKACVGLLSSGIALLVTGCSGTTTVATDDAFGPRIREYVGDGGGSLKPWPGLVSAFEIDEPAAVATKLQWAVPPMAGKVPRRQVNWYRMVRHEYPGLTFVFLVTLQPTADEDADLYVLEGKGKNLSDGADLLGCSTRTPTAAGPITGGYAPDWVAFDAEYQGFYPAAHIAVFGYNEKPGTKHYKIECDSPVALDLDLEYVLGFGQHESLWSYFEATAGTSYTVSFTDGVGDIDIFVYGDSSSEFIGSDTTSGDATIPFTAAETGRHYIRAYGYAAGPNGGELEVTSP